MAPASWRAFRLALPLLLALLTTGLPGVIGTITHQDCCAGECERSLDGHCCPPNCSLGSCNKASPTVPPTANASGPVAHLPPVPALPASAQAPVLPLVLDDVFRPPQA